MPDITMCTGNCPVNEYCYRYMAEADPYWQSYSMLEEVCIPYGYSEIIPYKKRIKEDEDSNSIDYTLDDFLLAEIHKIIDCELN